MLTQEPVWASNFRDFSSLGKRPLTDWLLNSSGGGGYWADGDHHYDVLWCLYQMEDYAIKHNLDFADAFKAPIAAALKSWRDYAVLANYPPGMQGQETPGVQNYHLFLSGIAEHYIRSGKTDTEDVQAADILLSPNWTPTKIDRNEAYYHLDTIRPNALQLIAALDRDRMGLGEHPAVHSFARIALRHLNDCCNPNKFGVAFKPFMVGLAMRGLIMYWQNYQPSFENPFLRLIESTIKNMCRHLMQTCWYEEEGAISYLNIESTDPLMTPVSSTITKIIRDREIFCGAPGLSKHDGFYSNNIIEFESVKDKFLISSYMGWGLNQIQISDQYYPGWALKIGDRFTISSATSIKGEGPGPTPDLNHMVAPAFAWAYWLDNSTLEYRNWFVKLFNTGQQAIDRPYGQKQMNQSVYWMMPALEWIKEIQEPLAIGDLVYYGAPPKIGVIRSMTPLRIQVFLDEQFPGLALSRHMSISDPSQLQKIEYKNV